MTWTIADLLTCSLVVITAVYAALTFGILRSSWRSVDTMRQQTEALSRPYITVSPFVMPNNPILYLHISNTGKTAAERVRLTLDRAYYELGGMDERDNLATYAAFTHEIASFAPGVKLIFALASAPLLFSESVDETRTPRVFRIRATYRFAGRSVTEATDVDLRPYRGMHIAFDPLQKELKGIKDALKKLADAT